MLVTQLEISKYLLVFLFIFAELEENSILFKMKSSKWPKIDYKGKLGC